MMLSLHPPAWTITQKILFRFMVLFVTLFMLTLSFPKTWIPDLPSLISPFFVAIVKWTGQHIFKIKHPYTAELVSDSTGLYIHLFVLFVISAIIAALWSIADKKRRSYAIFSYWFRVALSYYLAFYLFVYGFNKAFKWQFYLPEPNTLFTTVGNTYRDLLYWSTMGTSHSYNVFLGLTEILAGLLLVFRRTRLLGSLVALGIMVNVVMINFSFDINVKIYSSFFLLLSLLIVAADRKRLYAFFLMAKPLPERQWEPQYVTAPVRWIYFAAKFLTIAYMLWSVLFIYLRSGNFNDDKAPRPLFHGAYEVPVFIKNKDTLLPLITDTFRWRRLFIHRRGYLIIEAMNDEMQDFTFECDTVSRQWFIKEEGSGRETIFHYMQVNDTTIFLTANPGTDSLQIQLQKIDLKKLPVLQNEFNWTIDD